MDSINNVCRVCLATNNLKWVFDRKLYCVQKMNLKNVILTVTGVEILAEDTISQKICTNCYRTAIRMYQFRMRAMKNNSILKERYNGMLKILPIEHGTPNATIILEKKVESEMEIKDVIPPNYRIHRSVRDILKKFPRVKLPSPWLISNIEPCIMLEKDTVDNFLKEKANHRIDKENTLAASIASDPLRTSSLSSMDIEINCGDNTFNKQIDQKNPSESEIVRDNSNNGYLDGIDNITVEPEKRNTDSEFFSDTKLKDSSSPTFPKEKPVGKSAEGLCLGKSVPLIVCSICNSVHDNVKKLERHQLRHLRCQFCRSMFKTIRSMEIHIKSSCAIKNVMTSLPSVELERIELNQIMRTKYPEAFIDFPLIPGLQLIPMSADETSEYEVSVNDKKAVGYIDGCSDNTNDAIEILSDDDTTLPSVNNILNNTPVCRKVIIPVRNSTQSRINNVFLPTTSTVREKVSTDSSVISTTFSLSSVASPVVSATVPFISRHPTSGHMVEPVIRIKNSSVVDKIEPGLSDIESIRKILTDTTALKKDGFSQTALSSSTSVYVDESSGAIELKDMVNILILYRVPLLFKKGYLQAQYDYNSINIKPKQRSKLCLWNEMFPVDIKETNIRTYSRHNRFSTPVNSSRESSNVNVQHQVVPSNPVIISVDPCSKIKKHVSIQSNCLIAKNPTYVPTEANIASMQTTPISHLNDMRSFPDVNPYGIPYLAIPKICPLASHISVSSTSDVSNTDSTIYKPHNSLAVQNKVTLTDPAPNLVPITTASSSNEAVPVFGSIRVKSLWDLT